MKFHFHSYFQESWFNCVSHVNLIIESDMKYAFIDWESMLPIFLTEDVSGRSVSGS